MIVKENSKKNHTEATRTMKPTIFNKVTSVILTLLRRFSASVVILHILHVLVNNDLFILYINILVILAGKIFY